MAIRAGMTALVARLRVVIGDPSGASAAFTDEDLQAFLDERRFDVDRALLRADSVGSGSPTVFRAPVRFWESDVVLADGSGSALDPDEAGSDALAGVWTFASGQWGIVSIAGRYYDLYGAAATALTAWAATVAREFDFATDNQRFDRSQKREGLLAAARELARRSISPGMRPSWGTPTWES